MRGLLDKGTKIKLALFVTGYSMLVLGVKFWESVSSDSKHNHRPPRIQHTFFRIQYSGWLRPASVQPSAEKQDKSWTQELSRILLGMAHTVVQMHCLSCNKHYYTGTWGSLNDFVLDDFHWNIPVHFMLSWKALLVSSMLCRILAALNHYNRPYNGPMAIAETLG